MNKIDGSETRKTLRFSKHHTDAHWARTGLIFLSLAVSKNGFLRFLSGIQESSQKFISKQIHIFQQTLKIQNEGFFLTKITLKSPKILQFKHE